MKTQIALLALVAAAVFLAGCSQYGGQQQDGTQQANASAVTIQNFAFSPQTLNVKVGATVTWTNRDTQTHTVKSDSFSSAVLNQGESFQYTFTTKGTYNYICSIHPAMKGTIVVE